MMNRSQMCCQQLGLAGAWRFEKTDVHQSLVTKSDIDSLQVLSAHLFHSSYHENGTLYIARGSV
jgi:hypothetical protein